MIYLLLSFLLAGGDLTVKTMVDRAGGEKLPKELADGFVTIRREKNKGFAGNRCEEEPETVGRISAVILALATVVLLPVFLSKKKTIAEKFGGSIFLGGAISNVVERNLRGYVVDYLQVKTDKLYKADNKLPHDVDVIYRDAVKRIPLRNATFNLSDVFIVLGGVIVVSGCFLRELRK